MPVETTIQLRRGLSHNWVSVNPILAEGEAGLELDTRKMKIGDGRSYWNDLPYSSKQFDNIYINNNTISSANSNGDIILSPNGNGRVKIGQNEVATKADIDSISNVSGNYARKDQNNIFDSSHSNVFNGVVNLNGIIQIGGQNLETSAAELNYLNQAEPGVAVPNKSLVADQNLDISGLRNLYLTQNAYSNNKKLATEDYVQNTRVSIEDYINQIQTSLENSIGSVGQDTQNYIRQNLEIKKPVKVATTENIELAGLKTIDGVSLSIGDRVLVKNQTNSSNNGIYNVSSSVWQRSDDADTTAKMMPGIVVFVSNGNINAGGGWVLLDSTMTGPAGFNFSQFTGAGQITAGDGLYKNGNRIDVVGVLGRISATSLGIDLAPVSGLVTGNYTKVSVDAYGRVTQGSNPSTLAGYGIVDAIPANETLISLTSTANFAGRLVLSRNASEAQSILNLVVGQDVQAYSSTLDSLSYAGIGQSGSVLSVGQNGSLAWGAMDGGTP